jgi:hypothetical protein
MLKDSLYKVREIKEDGKGLYVNYGGVRLRPQIQPTKFKKGQEVYMDIEPFATEAKIFTDTWLRETWIQATKVKFHSRVNYD